MYTVSLATVVGVLVSYGLIFLVGFLLMSMFTAGDPVLNPDSFFYLYENMALSHPAVLTLSSFAFYWLFGTALSLHKYLVASSMLQWYF